LFFNSNLFTFVVLKLIKPKTHMETTVKFVSKKVAKELHNLSYLSGIATSLKIEKSLKYGIATVLRLGGRFN